MDKNPSSFFFWNDWENEPGLRMCSLAAQGLWMRMLCIAAKAVPPGFVQCGTQPCTAQDIARMVGESKETVDCLLDELKRHGVFSVTRRGIIFNRRMVRDAKRRETNRKNGKLGGQASYRNRRGIFGLPEQEGEQLTERPPDSFRTPEASPPIKNIKIGMDSLPRARARPSSLNGESYTKREKRDAWFWNLMAPYVHRRLPESEATALIAGWERGDKDAVMAINILDKERKMREESVADAS